MQVRSDKQISHAQATQATNCSQEHDTQATQKVFVPPDFCYLNHCHTSMGEVGCYTAPKCMMISWMFPGNTLMSLFDQRSYVVQMRLPRGLLKCEARGWV